LGCYGRAQHPIKGSLGDACPCRQGRFFGGWTAKGHVLCQKEMTAFLEFVKGHLDSRTQKTGSTCLGYKISKKAEPFLTPPFMFDTES
jgi:hypothetical protein